MTTVHENGVGNSGRTDRTSNAGMLLLNLLALATERRLARFIVVSDLTMALVGSRGTLANMRTGLQALAGTFALFEEDLKPSMLPLLAKLLWLFGTVSEDLAMSE